LRSPSANSGERERRERERLRAALVAAIADHGWQGSGVAEVCRRSGLSERAFHTHYDDLPSCFEDVCVTAMEEARAAAMAGWREGHGWEGRLHSACAALVAHVEGSSDLARATLLESLRAGPGATDAVREALSFNERALVMAFQLHPNGFPTSRLTPRGIVGGVRRVLSKRLEAQEGVEHHAEREGGETEREGGEVDLTEEIVSWISCFRAPSMRRLTQLAASESPMARSGPSRRRYGGELAQVRKALIHAMLQEGRQSLEGETLARFAGVSEERLQQAHRGVEGSLESLVGHFDSDAFQAIFAAYINAEDWPSGVHASVHAAVDEILRDSDLSTIRMLRLPLVPSVAVEHEGGFSQILLDVVSRHAPAPRYAPAIAREAVAGAVDDVLRWRTAGRSVRVRGFADQLSFILLAPYLGPEEAVSAVLEASKRARG